MNGATYVLFFNADIHITFSAFHKVFAATWLLKHFFEIVSGKNKLAELRVYSFSTESHVNVSKNVHL